MHVQKLMTMRELARIAEVDHSTVSRALRRHPSVAPATQQKILRLAKQHGYVQNPLISACMTFRKRANTATHAHTTLAYLSNYPPEFSRWEDMRAANYNGALIQAEHRGYRLEEFHFPPGLAAQRIRQILRTRNIHGVIVAPYYDYGDASLDSLWGHFCAVAIGLSLNEPPLHHVAHDYYHGMLLALHECRIRGALRIGFAISEFTNKRMQGRWLAAYLLEQQSFNASDRPTPFIATGNTAEGAELRHWIASERLDAVIGLPFNLSTETWPEFIGKLPAPIEWIYLDIQNPSGKNTGIYQNHEKIGAAAVDLLIGLLELNQPGPLESPQTLSIAGCWVDGRRQARGEAEPDSMQEMQGTR